jgi:UDP-GlcNAc:undecaprenyl-phosphate GlcNAc-1-phosphate transferase
MPDFVKIATFALGSFVLAYALIPYVITIATRMGLLDHPSDPRRIHRVAVPRLGGVAVFIAMIAAIGASLYFRRGIPLSDLELQRELSFALSLTIVFGTGLLDDLWGLSPRKKLVGQTIAAAVAAAYVFVPETVVLAAGMHGWSLHWLAYPLFVIWIVGVTNAFNLIDGMDGLAGTTAVIGLMVSVGLDAFGTHAGLPLVAAAVIGAVLAFLRYNMHPARLFLGDSGSMVLGFFLAVRLVASSTNAEGQTYLLLPLAGLALPLIDTAIAIVRRGMRGDPFAKADGRHIHHQMLALGITPRTTLTLLGAFFGIVAIVGVVITFAPPQLSLTLMLGGGALSFATFWYGARWLRYHEFFAFGSSLASVMRNARTVLREKILADEVAERLRSAASLQELREIVSELVADSSVLAIEVLSSKEDFHAHGPRTQRISSYDALPVRLDYPFTRESSDGTREMILRIWCPRPQSAGVSHVAERVAARLGPAIELWFRNQPHNSLTGEFELGEVRRQEQHLPRSSH